MCITIQHSPTAGGRCRVTRQATPAGQVVRAGANGLHGRATRRPTETRSPVSAQSQSVAMGIPKPPVPGTGKRSCMRAGGPSKSSVPMGVWPRKSKTWVLILSNVYPMHIYKAAKGMQKLLEPLWGGCNEHNIISIEQDEGCQQCQVRGMRLARRWGMCSNEFPDPV